MPEKVAVIGAGIAGLAAAIRLAVKGYQVEVFEKNDGPGGKMGELTHAGFRFDTGPSLFTLPTLIEELYSLAGEDMAGKLEFQKLHNVCRYFYEDGMEINAFGDADAFTEELCRKAGEDKTRVRKYLDESRFIFDFTYPVFIRNSLHLRKNYLKREFLTAFARLNRLKPFRTLHQQHLRYFRHPNTINLFDRFATYNGSSPYKAPATLMVIPHLEHNIGAYFPAGGMHIIAKSLAGLAERLGVVFHYGTEVDEILTGGRRSKGEHGLQMADGRQFNGYQAVVTDLDIYFVYKKLLRNLPFPGKWFRHERSTSALIFYWGMRLRSVRLDIHNILFSSDYRQEFQYLFDFKSLQPDPTIYIFISSKAVPGDAPEGCENWFVMINVPPDEGQNWTRLIEEARIKIEARILKLLGIKVAEHRLFEFVIDPLEIERKTASFKGSLYGNSSNSMFAAFRRHPNFSGIPGIYHTGGSVHPGGGIPLCLSSAKIAIDLLPSIKP